MNTMSRIRGGLLGLACGDALGATLEFLPKRQIRLLAHRNIIGGGMLKWKAGEITDDTGMTIAVTEGILDNPRNPVKTVGDRFVKWFNANPVDVGHTCRVAIKNFQKTRSWEIASELTHFQCGQMSAGNGTLMRTLPISLVYRNDVWNIIKLSGEISKMTHYDDQASEACELYGQMIYNMMNTKLSKIEILELVLEGNETYRDVFKLKFEDVNPSGYVVDTFKCVLWAFINTETLEQCILEAVNLQGDSDTIGAIAGGLAGVYYGYDEIPTRWLKKLIIKPYLEDLCNDILHAGEYYNNVHHSHINTVGIPRDCFLYDPKTDRCDNEGRCYAKCKRITKYLRK
jgi:ADP-ribosyl-[dinitrogen reductase] hydrolase